MISSHGNHLIKRVKKLHTRGGRERYGQYFIEGIRGVEQVLENGAPLKEVLYSQSTCRLERGRSLLERLKGLDIRTVEVDEELFKAIADTESPQYIMAVVEMERYGLDAVRDKPDTLLVIVDGIQDPGNLGTIIRTSDAAGVDGIILLKGTADPYNPKTIRGTMGSIFSLPIIQEKDTPDLLDGLHSRGVKVVAASLEGSTPYYQEDYRGKTAIVVGNEACGISKEVKERADVSVRLPMAGKAESLNAAVACGIILFKAVEQRLT